MLAWKGQIQPLCHLVEVGLCLPGQTNAVGGRGWWEGGTKAEMGDFGVEEGGTVQQELDHVWEGEGLVLVVCS